MAFGSFFCIFVAMNNKIWGLFLVLLLGWCGGCIENDIPYPVIVGEVKQIEFAGQKELKIDAAKREITLVLNDTVDMRAVEVLAFELSEEARATIKKGDLLDFSNGDKAAYVVSDNAYQFTVSTYQDYEWKIAVSQPLGRKIEVDGSVGEANIDTESKLAVVDVSDESTDLYGVVVRAFCLGPALATYSPDPFSITDYSKPRTITVSFFGLTEEWTIAMRKVKVNVLTGTVNAWAKFAEVTGDASASSPLTPSFEYRKKGDTEWQTEAATRVGGKISAVLKGLAPNTDYVFRAKLGEELAAEKTFRTEATPLIGNMGFEEWAQEGKNWFPNATAGNIFWATGNEGVTSVAPQSNTAPTTEVKEGQRAAKIATIDGVPMVGLAAGSLFTGDFKTEVMAPLTSPKFGRPYQGRPTQLSFWYKYAPTKVTKVGSGTPEDMMNKTDRCLIYIYLGDWEGTLTSIQLREPDKSKIPGAIAYGEFVTDKSVTSYTQQTIKLTYFDKTRPVKKILIVGTSSIYGDFYTGGEGSTLYWDDLQFGWDYVE